MDSFLELAATARVMALTAQDRFVLIAASKMGDAEEERADGVKPGVESGVLVSGAGTEYTGILTCRPLPVVSLPVRPRLRDVGEL